MSAIASKFAPVTLASGITVTARVVRRMVSIDPQGPRSPRFFAQSVYSNGVRNFLSHVPHEGAEAARIEAAAWLDRNRN